MSVASEAGAKVLGVGVGSRAGLRVLPGETGRSEFQEFQIGVASSSFVQQTLPGLRTPVHVSRETSPTMVAFHSTSFLCSTLSMICLLGTGSHGASFAVSPTSRPRKA